MPVFQVVSATIYTNLIQLTFTKICSEKPLMPLLFYCLPFVYPLFLLLSPYYSPYSDLPTVPFVYQYIPVLVTFTIFDIAVHIQIQLPCQIFSFRPDVCDPCIFMFPRTIFFIFDER